MKGTWTIAKREIQSFFMLPIAYVVLTVWLLYFGSVLVMLAQAFAGSPGAGGPGLLTSFFGGTTLFYIPLLIFAPALTMRLMAEESSSGTLEPLLTAPVNDWSIVLGKYIAAMAFWCTLWGATPLYFWIVNSFGNDVVDLGVMGSTYLGLFSIGLLYMAVGLFMSTVSKSQIVAALLTFLVLGLLLLIGLFAYFAQGDEERAVYEYLSVWGQMATFAKGIIDTRFLVFDVTVAALAVFASVRVVQSNRWQ